MLSLATSSAGVAAAIPAVLFEPSALERSRSATITPLFAKIWCALWFGVDSCPAATSNCGLVSAAAFVTYGGVERGVFARGASASRDAPNR